MLLCWHQDVARRPTFAKVVEYFKPLAGSVAAPAIKSGKDSNKKFESADNEYNDFGFGDSSSTGKAVDSASIDGAGAGVQKQNPLFVEETGFGFGEDE